MFILSAKNVTFIGEKGVVITLLCLIALRHSEKQCRNAIKEFQTSDRVTISDSTYSVVESKRVEDIEEYSTKGDTVYVCSAKN